MHRGLKQLIKAVLPRSFLHAALEARDALWLAATPRTSYDATKLRPMNAGDLDAILHNGAAETTWPSDHAAIREVVGEDDKSGGINPGDRRAVYYLVRALAPRSVLEIGTHIGASTLYIARAVRSSAQGGKVTTVDILDVNQPDGPWKQAGLTAPPREMIERIHCTGVVHFAVSPAIDFMLASDQKFDFVFLDGDHAARAVYREVAAALKLLQPGGVILLHDYYPGGKVLFPDDNLILGPFRALSRVGRENLQVSVLPLGNLPWETKQGVKVTSLALVTRR